MHAPRESSNMTPDARRQIFIYLGAISYLRHHGEFKAIVGTMGKNNKRRRQPVGKAQKISDEGEPSFDDWISELAKKESASQSSRAAATTTQEERIEKRAAKKLRREAARKHKHDDSVSDLSRKNTIRYQKRGSSERLFQTVAADVRASVHHALGEEDMPAKTSRRRPRPYAGAQVKPYKKLKWDVEHTQPRRNDYGGIGLARASLFLSFDDPSFFPKLEEEFKEHIPGFFGKQRTKAMKKQLNKNMLWRRMADQKKGVGKGKPKIDGKKLSDMSADEKVEAMIKAGMI